MLQLTSSEQDYLDTPVKALAAPRYAQLLALLSTTSRLFWQPTRMLRLLLVARVHLLSHVHCGHRARAHLYRIEEPCIWGGQDRRPQTIFEVFHRRLATRLRFSMPRCCGKQVLP